MSAESDNIRDRLAEQLADLDTNLGATVDDVRMLSSVQQGIGRLLTDDGAGEAEIRRMLEDQFSSGQLRRETYQLVKSMLDRYVTEHVDTVPGVVATDDGPLRELGQVDEPPVDEYSSTTVLPNEPLRVETADDRVQVGSVLRDRFLLQEKVSGGSMGVVYKALDRRLAETGADTPWVAIKVLSPELAQSGPALRALQQEAAKGRYLTHPNIVRFLDFDRDDDLYFIVMEWLDGRTLADILDSPDGKQIDARQSLDIVRQVGAALDHAHRCGIVHADVKPGNVMLKPDGTAMLFDFGVARVRQTQLSESQSFDPGVLGAITPAYSSMQVLTGEEPAPSDDVFSLACLYYRLVAGYRVFGPRNAAEAAEEGMKPQQPANMQEKQWRAVKKALSYARVTRFESMSAFLEALDIQNPAAQPAAPGAITVDAEERLATEAPKESSRGIYGVLILLAIATALAFFGYTNGYYQQLRDWLGSGGDTAAGDEPVMEIAPAPEPDLFDGAVDEADEVVEEPIDALAPLETDGEDVTDELLTEEVDESLMPDAAEEVVEPPPPAANVIDYSRLPPADVEVPLTASTEPRAPIAVTLREDRGPVTVDLFRTDSLEEPLTLRIEEVAHSGNRSPWTSGQYELASDEIIEIPPGQDRARITLIAASDPLREADQQSTLRIREANTPTLELAAIEVELEDDDQRRFEGSLPPNTIAFAVSQVSVMERDPAVQIDILRFNPDGNSVVVGYAVREVTATAGEDYFEPGGYSVSFGPGQRSTRLLIPLVQDSLVEGDEAFSIELAVGDVVENPDVYTRVVVMIRDDEDGSP
ncbi:MAG: protein kinase [Woeseiaceae bacterium]|nr:protein kinase [Woeseiaceae bacterium]